LFCATQRHVLIRRRRPRLRKRPLLSIHSIDVASPSVAVAVGSLVGANVGSLVGANVVVVVVVVLSFNEDDTLAS